jgi:hypothetical protein
MFVPRACFVLIFYLNLCHFFCLFISVYFIALFDIIHDLFMCFLEVYRYFELQVLSGFYSYT